MLLTTKIAYWYNVFIQEKRYRRFYDGGAYMDYAALAKVLHEIMPDSVSEVERYLTCFSCFRYLKNIIEKKGAEISSRCICQ